YVTGVFYMRPWYRFDSIMIGCAGALILRTRSIWRAALEATAGWSPAWFLGAIVGLSIVRDTTEVSKPFYLTAQLVLATWLVFHVIIAPRAFVGRVLSSTPFAALGILSYSLYLWQQVLCASETPPWGVLREFPYCVGMSLLAAFTSYRFVEQP